MSNSSKMRVWTSLTLCVSFGLALAEPAQWTPAKSDIDSVRMKRAYDHWLDIISQYRRREAGSDSAGIWQPFPVDLPFAGRDGRPTHLPLLVLPVPVPVPDPSIRQACDANSNREESNKLRDNTYKYRGSNNRFEVDSRFKENYYNEERDEVTVNTSVSSDHLIKLFREEHPTAPELPPALIDYAPDILQPSVKDLGSSRAYLPPSEKSAPNLPRFERSMLVRGFLTVNNSDYTEAYTVWYDAANGASKVDYHDGGTLTYRSVTPDQKVQRFVRYTDRTVEEEVLVCGISSLASKTAEDRTAPALPDTSQFSFAGYKEAFEGRVEVWKREIIGQPGELGAVRGEALTYRHELIVARRNDGLAVPLKYTVAIDSSVLGKDVDGYQHVYSEVRLQDHHPNTFIFNPDEECEKREQLDTANPEHMARLDPMREFTLSQRDSRYDSMFESYIKDFERSYADDKEMAMRKTLLVQHNRFVSSCNRQSATFSLETNYLSDRLEAEIEVLLGAVYSPDNEVNKLEFPLSKDLIRGSKNKLPMEFDWRTRGGVTPVKFQGASCSSCWAFAVTGSVEGALFIKTKVLVELSEQCLVDCGHSHEAHGCKGTWPSAAYNYIKDRGLPARNEYTPYAEKVLKCRDREIPPVTHISGYVDVPPNNLNALKLAIRRFAPNVVVVDAKAKTFIYYKKGVLKDDRCVKGPKKKLNHAVLAVGWGELNSEPYFIIKNSWHQNWGEGGYIRLHAPSNTCGHLTTPSYPELKREDVDRLPGGAQPSSSNDDEIDDER